MLFRVDLADFWSGRVSLDTFLALVERLPLESRSEYRAAILGFFDFIGWDTNSSLLADVFDATQQGTRALVKVQGGRMKAPSAHPRPERKRVITSDDVASFPIHLVVGMSQ